MTTLQPIPKEIVQLIPQFGGDKRQLNLYLRKCQYVINRFKGNEEQNLYVFNVLTSRLTQDAAALLSEREDIVTWSDLKVLLIQHFGDPRSEACINIELESLKIKSGESYLEFCNRIQSVRSSLMSKVNLIDDPNLKNAKFVIYNNTALNVFLYNLPENMVRVVRLKAPATLEEALSIVLEEVNFHDQYNTRNRIHSNNQNTVPRPFHSPANNQYNNKFNSVTPQNTQGRPTLLQTQPQRPHSGFGYGPQQFGFSPRQPTGFKQPQHFGYRPPPTFGYKPPQPFGYKPPHQFGYKPPQQPGFKLPQHTGFKPLVGNNAPQASNMQPQSTDVSMRTAPYKPQTPQQGFQLNELTMYNHESYYDEGDYYHYNPQCDFGINYCGENNYIEHPDLTCEELEKEQIAEPETDFQEAASSDKKS